MEDRFIVPRLYVSLATLLALFEKEMFADSRQRSLPECAPRNPCSLLAANLEPESLILLECGMSWDLTAAARRPTAS